MTTHDPVPPVPSATVLLVRETEGNGWQCFMIRRPAASVFAGDMWVFPGGKIDPHDRDCELDSVCVTARTRGLASEEWRDWVAVRIAAIRELFEEAGVLLGDAGGSMDRGADRRAVQCGSLSLTALATRDQIRFPLDDLHPLARWITPESFPRRFDATFFIARLPEGQEPRAHHRETVDALWISPGEALRRHQAGGFPLVFATEQVLLQVSEYRSIEDLLASTRNAVPSPVLPRIVDTGDERRILLPGDPGY